jgi:hypothetical protein
MPTMEMLEEINLIQKHISDLNLAIKQLEELGSIKTDPCIIKILKGQTIILTNILSNLPGIDL